MAEDQAGTSLRRAMEHHSGLGVSRGVAVGPAVCLEAADTDVYRFPIEDAERELERLDRAVEEAGREIDSLSRKVEDELGQELAGIFSAHSMLLRDDLFLSAIRSRVRDEKVNVEWAVVEALRELRARFARIKIEHLRERGEDLREVGRYLLRSLQGIAHHEISEIEDDVVVVAEDLTPSDAVRLGRQHIAGFVLEGGGRTSHTAIIAHSLGIPLVTGVAGVLRRVTTDDPVIVDGSRGVVILHPDSDTIASYLEQVREQEVEEARQAETRDDPARSLDGVDVELMANIDLVEEIEDAKRHGTKGIGLYRSEFLYIETSPELPSEEAQLRAYTSLLESMPDQPVIVRTFDLGGRKLAREVLDTREENPVLGLRGVRLTLAKPEIFKTQLRALFRAGCRGQLWVMLPMVSNLDEIRRFRDFAMRVIAELDEEGLPHCGAFKLGTMIEVPSAALIAPQLAREVDFFSIGTNDLIQYALAVDRNNDHVADLYQPLHPAVLRMIRFVVRSAREAGIEVSVCGEMAGDPIGAPMLLGLGIRRLSMSPRSVPRIKALIRSLSMADWSALAEECVELATASEVRACIDARMNTSRVSG